MTARGGRRVLPALGGPAPAVGAGVAALAFRHGGYDATAWSWGTLAACAAVAIAVVRRQACPLSRSALVHVGALATFGAWIAVECLRAGAATRGVPVLERTGLYVAAAWAGVIVVRREHVQAALAALLTAITGVTLVGLYDVLLGPVTANRFEGRLLFQPLGYANACGILAVIGILLALGRPGSRLAATALVPLSAALALTESRGAAVACATGVLVYIAISSRRLAASGHAVLTLALPLACAVVAARSHVLDVRTTTSVLARDGRLLAVFLVLASAAQLVLAPLLQRLAASVHVQHAVVLFSFLAVVALALHGLGSPFGDRADYWRVAWTDAQAHPLAGSGPGSFAVAWTQLRPSATGALNAHNLYLETLAELGPLGLVLLVCALAAPLVAAVRRRTTVSSAAAAAYAAFVVHAALDWDWQMPAVTVAALICGACVLSDPRSHTRADGRALLAGATLLALVAGAAGVGAHALAARDAALAATWQPWSAEPVRLLGERDAASGDVRGARLELRHAVQLDPANLTAWFDLLRLGSPADRRIALERIATLDPLAIRRSGR